MSYIKVIWLDITHELLYVQQNHGWLFQNPHKSHRIMVVEKVWNNWNKKKAQYKFLPGRLGRKLLNPSFMFCFENLSNASSKPCRLSWLLIAKSSAGWEAKKGNITFISLEPEIHFKRRFFIRVRSKHLDEKKK